MCVSERGCVCVCVCVCACVCAAASRYVTTFGCRTLPARHTCVCTYVGKGEGERERKCVRD